MRDYNEGRPLNTYYDKPFLQLDMMQILNISFLTFEKLTEKMEEKTRRTAWFQFIQRTVFCYIQCMINSSKSIKQKSSADAINKIKQD